MNEGTTRLSYLRSLELWLKASEKYLYQPPGRTDWLVYGSGFDSWGVQTQQKALAAYGVAATDSDFDRARAGVSRDELFGRFQRMLRFGSGGSAATPGRAIAPVRTT